jgi:arginase
VRIELARSRRHAEEIPDPDLREGEIGRTFEIARRVARATRAAIGHLRLPVVLSGNCNSSLGTAAAGDRIGVLWFDAHADFGVPDDSLSGFFDVMALSRLHRLCWAALRETIPGFRAIPEDNVVLVGGRDLEPYEPSRRSHPPWRQSEAARECRRRCGSRRRARPRS